MTTHADQLPAPSVLTARIDTLCQQLASAYLGAPRSSIAPLTDTSNVLQSYDTKRMCSITPQPDGLGVCFDSVHAEEHAQGLDVQMQALHTALQQAGFSCQFQLQYVHYARGQVQTRLLTAGDQARPRIRLTIPENDASVTALETLLRTRLEAQARDHLQQAQEVLAPLGKHTAQALYNVMLRESQAQNRAR